MKKTTLNLRVDSKLKKQAEQVVSGLGISMSSAIVLYLNALVRENGIPFDLRGDDKGKKQGSLSKTARAKTGLNKKKTKKTNSDEDLPGLESLKAALSKL
ncbi:MAG: type II toxin-antitoxin system RelB/DinJ family antitoxin [Enterococcus sp.]|nr:type II toxin-antitoxin system RelB/DinJ family antitoxin [Enterococcus sp.]